ncbi:ribosome silencing factor [Rarobacter faecitabidus]|uniref:ribosome silencing factor n=1 Tax=Rarobacter faecitabidus TaxID=13243 RepID=UPI00114D784A|nr:ribosome silencing factor [Rarobacter faecitabidus]
MTATERAIELTIAAARAASDKKAGQVIALDVSEQLVLTDVFVITSGRNDRQVKAIVDGVEEAMHKEGVKALRREGLTEAHWVLLDFGDIVVHVQQEQDREFYALERLWKDCPLIELPEDARGGDGDTSEYDEFDQFGFAAGTYRSSRDEDNQESE